MKATNTCTWQSFHLQKVKPAERKRRSYQVKFSGSMAIQSLTHLRRKRTPWGFRYSCSPRRCTYSGNHRLWGRFSNLIRVISNKMSFSPREYVFESPIVLSTQYWLYKPGHWSIWVWIPRSSSWYAYWYVPLPGFPCVLLLQRVLFWFKKLTITKFPRTRPQPQLPQDLLRSNPILSKFRWQSAKALDWHFQKSTTSLMGPVS